MMCCLAAYCVRGMCVGCPSAGGGAERIGGPSADAGPVRAVAPSVSAVPVRTVCAERSAVPVRAVGTERIGDPCAVRRCMPARRGIDDCSPDVVSTLLLRCQKAAARLGQARWMRMRALVGRLCLWWGVWSRCRRACQVSQAS